MNKNKKFLFTSRHIEAIFGTSRKKLNYWRKIGLFSASDKTDGGHYLYSFKDLLTIKAISSLKEKGISIKTIKQVLKKLGQQFPEKEAPLAETSLFVIGKEVLISDRETSYNPLTGQGYLIRATETEKWVNKKAQAIFDIPQSTEEDSQRYKGKAAKSKVPAGG